MKTPRINGLLSPAATLLVDPQRLYYVPAGQQDVRSGGGGRRRGDDAPAAKATNSKPPLRQCVWNPDSLSWQDGRLPELLSQAIRSLIAKAERKHPINLVISDALAVTRIATGTSAAVSAEQQDINQRSQLYLGLGSGEKLIGELRIEDSPDHVYAATVVSPLQRLQLIFEAIDQSKLKLASIEPVVLATTRQIGLLGLDGERPLLLVFMDRDRCEVAISHRGRLMLSYRIGEGRDMRTAAALVANHLVRLERFCGRYRNIRSHERSQLLVLGVPEAAETLREHIKGVGSQVEVLCVNDLTVCHRDDGNCDPVLRLALDGSIAADRVNGVVPRTDLLQRLLTKQPRSRWEAIRREFWPTMVAAGLLPLMLAGSTGVSRWQDTDGVDLTTLQDKLDGIQKQLIWEKQKETLLRRMQKVQSDLVPTDWEQVIPTVARCLTHDAQLDLIQLVGRDRLVLKGDIKNEANVYEIITALKRQSFIATVSIESLANGGGDELQQFDIRCQLTEPSL